MSARWENGDEIPHTTQMSGFWNTIGKNTSEDHFMCNNPSPEVPLGLQGHCSPQKAGLCRVSACAQPTPLSWNISSNTTPPRLSLCNLLLISWSQGKRSPPLGNLHETHSTQTFGWHTPSLGSPDTQALSFNAEPPPHSPAHQPTPPSLQTPPPTKLASSCRVWAVSCLLLYF